MRSCSLLGRICSTALARRSQFALSSGATTTICPRICMPVRKSLRWKAASASLRSAAAGLVTWPASVLIWASSLIAASARSLRLKPFSAAKPATDNSSTNAAARAARANATMGATSSFPPAWGISERVVKDEWQKVSRSWRNLRRNARQLAANLRGRFATEPSRNAPQL